ncbi:geranylgeranyl reductase family protein [Hymenobacter sp. NBH84]|uniref:NAD(P)/FAD-dependent oxidoreductase n=1 Tax=Hymenobacter sp. NBH84 TaxID=2596915 RepID=UPI001624A5DE|nr:geranylgeranyl reductase family protein [Hymenobacter sp. NBH84]QNE40409.1 geranylgeranyl reductase family protein [Hymenobacter sp. NBH84]
METPDYDVAILGAGPAGAACALALHGHGLRVVMVDKATFPRDKVCGDAIPGLALKALRQLNPAWHAELLANLTPRADTRDSRVVAPNGRELRIRWQLPTFNSPRLHFDDHLLQLVRRHTPTTIRECYAVRDIQTTPTGVQFLPADEEQKPLTARLLIACDGANSVAARRLTQRTIDKAYHCAAVRAYYSGIAGVDGTTTEFFFLHEYMAGYCWIFPVGNGVYNVGFGMLSEAVARQRVDLKKMLPQLLVTHPELARRFAGAQQLSDVEGFGLPLGGRPRPLAGERFLLCGDAASLIDPLQGHGIDTAMQSGILAARQAVRSCQHNDFSPTFLADYEHQVARQITSKLARSYRLMRLVAPRPWLMNVGFAVARQPLLKRWLLRVAG